MNVVLRSLVAPLTLPLATRFPPAESTVLPVVVSTTVNALVSVICVAAPVAVTVPAKSLVAAVSVIA